MAEKNVLIFETDVSLERQLNELLSSQGYMVYGAERLDALVRALKSTRFPVVLIDMDSPEVDPPDLAARIIEHDPDCMVIFTGSAITAASILQMMRGGAADFVPKPFDPSDVVTRVGLAFQRRDRRREQLRAWKKRAKQAEEAATSGTGGISPTVVAEFAEQAFQRLLNAEKRADEFERAMDREGASVSAKDAVVTAWVAHGDADFANGVINVGMKLNIDVRPPLSTGGEVLDKLSVQRPNMIIAGDHFPDMPGQLVIDSILSQYPEVQVVVVSGWGSSSRSVRLVSGNQDSQPMPMNTVNDLIDAIQEAKGRSSESVNSRDFAARFRSRHSDFIRRYQELRGKA